MSIDVVGQGLKGCGQQETAAVFLFHSGYLGVGSYTIHDLRRSCITNWARQLPIHVVQKLAGHSDSQATETYYLSVQPEDSTKARRMQSALVGDILNGAGTYPLLTHFYGKSNKCGLKRCFPAAREKGGPL